jgi:hypothetical protein
MLQEDWKNVGPVPKEYFEPLWNRFGRFKKDIFRNLKIAKRLKEEAEGIAPSSGARGEFRPSSYGDRRPREGDSRSSNGGSPYPPRPRTTTPPRPPVPAEFQEMYDAKMVLIKEAEQLTTLELRAATEQSKILQFKWRESGVLPAPFKNETNERFLSAVDRIQELNNVQKLAFERSHFIKSKPLKEQLTIKIAVVQELIKKDEAELVTNQRAFDILTVEEKALPPNKALYAKISNLRRRIRIKGEMLFDMQAQLAAVL